MRRIILNAWSLFLLLNVLNAKLSIYVAVATPPPESQTIKEIHNRSEQIDMVKFFNMEQQINFDRLEALHTAQNNVRAKRNDVAHNKSTSTKIRKDQSKRRRKTFFVPVICG